MDKTNNNRLFAGCLFLVVVAMGLTWGAKHSISPDNSMVWPTIEATTLFVVSLGAAQWFTRRHCPLADPFLLPCAALLSGLGLVAVYSRSDPRYSFLGFAWGIVLSSLALIMLSWYLRSKSDPFGNPFFQKLWLNFKAPPKKVYWFTFSLAACLAVALALLGQGPGRLNLFIFQPTHGIQILMVVFLAVYLTYYGEILWGLRRRQGGLPPLREFVPLLLMFALPLVLLVRIDLGPSLTLVLVFVAVFYIATGWRASVLLSAIVIGLASCGVYFSSPTFRLRCAMWWHPWDNGLQGGDQVARNLWALASGGWCGTGLGLGELKHIWAAPTDSVFAAVGEELGLLGTLAVVVLLSLIVLSGYHTAKRANNTFLELISMGLVVLLGTQTLVILGGTIGLLPLTGITVPFMSYGKTSLVTAYIVLGLLISASHHGNEIKAESRPYDKDLRLHSRRTLIAIGLGAMLLILWVVVVQGVYANRFIDRRVSEVVQDGSRREVRNPRLVHLGWQLPRGTIFDRRGRMLAYGSIRRRCYLMSTPTATAHTVGYVDLGRLNWLWKLSRFLDPKFSALAAATSWRERISRGPKTGKRIWVILGLFGQPNVDWRKYGLSGDRTAERRYDGQLRGYEDNQGLVAVFRWKDIPWLLPWNPFDIADIQITLDSDLQREALRALAAELDRASQRYGRHKYKGASVVLDVRTGAILASVSQPSFNPNSLRTEMPRALEEGNRVGRLLDRASQGQYPPGSVFKLVTAATALREGVSLVTTCDHWNARQLQGDGCVYPPGSISDAPGMPPHRRVDLANALADSCNVYFAELAVRLGYRSLWDMAVNGFGLRLMQQLAFTPGQLALWGFGQGSIKVSPLEMAQVVASIANDGVAMSPHILHSWRFRRTGVVSHTTPNVVGAPITPAAAATLQAAMRRVVTEGTAQRAFQGFSVPVAGKTGSAENDQEDRLPHSWFVGYAPHPDPRIAFAVVVENAGAGSGAAASVARGIVREAATAGWYATPSASIPAPASPGQFWWEGTGPWHFLLGSLRFLFLVFLWLQLWNLAHPTIQEVLKNARESFR